MAKDKVTPEQVAKQLAEAQKRARMTQEARDRQNKRVADRINKQRNK